MIFGSDRKKTPTKFYRFVVKGHVWNESVVTTQVRREVGVGTLWLANDQNNVIANKVLICF